MLIRTVSQTVCVCVACHLQMMKVVHHSDYSLIFVLFLCTAVHFMSHNKSESAWKERTHGENQSNKIYIYIYFLHIARVQLWKNVYIIKSRDPTTIGCADKSNSVREWNIAEEGRKDTIEKSNNNGQTTQSNGNNRHVLYLRDISNCTIILHVRQRARHNHQQIENDQLSTASRHKRNT